MLDFKIVLFLTVLLLNSSSCIANPTKEIIMEDKNECVVLLHGLARTSKSMATLEKALSKEGYNVVNV
ncbi:hypothetical protein KKA14_00455, partial [bacterium]|nr:hypothetical protein [bacterium]